MSFFYLFLSLSLLKHNRVVKRFNETIKKWFCLWFLGKQTVKKIFSVFFFQSRKYSITERFVTIERIHKRCWSNICICRMGSVCDDCIWIFTQKQNNSFWFSWSIWNVTIQLQCQHANNDPQYAQCFHPDIHTYSMRYIHLANTKRRMFCKQIEVSAQIGPQQSETEGKIIRNSQLRSNW